MPPAYDVVTLRRPLRGELPRLLQGTGGEKRPPDRARCPGRRASNGAACHAPDELMLAAVLRRSLFAGPPRGSRSSREGKPEATVRLAPNEHRPRRTSRANVLNARAVRRRAMAGEPSRESRLADSGRPTGTDCRRRPLRDPAYVASMPDEVPVPLLTKYGLPKEIAGNPTLRDARPTGHPDTTAKSWPVLKLTSRAACRMRR